MINYTVIPLGEILNNEYDERLIEQAFKKFSCQREIDLEDFLLHKAITYEKADFGKTYLLVDKDKLLNDNEFIIVAYFTIAQKAVDLSEMSNKKRRKMLGLYPGRDTLKSLPAYLIGQLGRSDSYSGADLSGQQILNECYHAISLAAKIVGGNMIVLECRECMYEKFYKDQEFKKFYDELSKDGLYTLYKKVDFKTYWSTR